MELFSDQEKYRNVTHFSEKRLHVIIWVWSLEATIVVSWHWKLRELMKILEWISDSSVSVPWTQLGTAFSFSQWQWLDNGDVEAGETWCRNNCDADDIADWFFRFHFCAFPLTVLWTWLGSFASADIAQLRTWVVTCVSVTLCKETFFTLFRPDFWPNFLHRLFPQ